MAARTTFKISDEVRDVLARSVITATSVTLPPGQLERKLYEQVNKALAGAGGKWSRKAGAHVFERDPRETLGLAVETGEATNVRATLQAYYTPPALARRVVELSGVKAGDRVLEPSVGEGALVLALAEAVGPDFDLVAYDIDETACQKCGPVLSDKVDNWALYRRDFLEVRTDDADDPLAVVKPGKVLRPVDVVVMNPPFTGDADVRHVTHAWEFVKPGGTLVAIMWPAWHQSPSTAAQRAFAALVRSVGGEVEDVPAGTFEHTDVATVVVKMRKLETPPSTRRTDCAGRSPDTGPFAQSISDALARPRMWISPDDDGFKVRVKGVSTQTVLDRLVERGFDARVCDDLVLVRLPSPPQRSGQR